MFKLKWNNQLCSGNQASKPRAFWNPYLLGYEISSSLDSGWFSLLEVVWLFLTKKESLPLWLTWPLEFDRQMFNQRLPLRSLPVWSLKAEVHFQGRFLLDDGQ